MDSRKALFKGSLVAAKFSACTQLLANLKGKQWSGSPGPGTRPHSCHSHPFPSLVWKSSASRSERARSSA